MTVHLFDVVLRRTYTPDYCAKFRSGEFYKDRPNHEDTKTTSWGESEQAVADRWAEHQRPGRYKSFDEMYQDSVVSITHVPDTEWHERAEKLRERHSPCCDLAIGRNCVCEWSSTCPVHGDRCHGSHD